MCEQEYFHGDITRHESEQRLAKSKKGDFIIRLSMTEPNKSPFTISKVNRNGVITHQRIYINSKRDGYYVSVKMEKDNFVKIESQGMVSNLIKKISKDLYLKNGCGGSKFSSIFQKEGKFGGYLQDFEP